MLLDLTWWQILQASRLLGEELFSCIIHIHDVTGTVTTNHSNSAIVASLMSCCMRRRSSNASVTSGKTSHVFHAVFLPLPLNAETVSHPVNACKTGRAAQILIHPSMIPATTSWTGMYWKFDRVPNASQSSSAPI